MGGARFLIRASTRVEGLAPGRSRSAPFTDGDGVAAGRADARLRRRRRRGHRPPDDRAGQGRARACASSACSTTTARKRNQILRGQKVLGSLDELADDRPRDRRAAAPDRDPVGLGRRRPAGRRGRDARSASRRGRCRRSTSSSRDGWAPPRSARSRSRTSCGASRSSSTSPACATSSRGETVLVTGAGGSIGSELARQVFDLDPATPRPARPGGGTALRHRARARRCSASATPAPPPATARPGRDLETRLANVASLDAMRRVIAEDRPVMVLHAAAYKHVPMMEHHPADAVYTNVGGTLAALRASLDGGVERFVLVSTDKAVEPTSVMGATKRLAEIAVAAAARAVGPTLRVGPVRQRPRVVGQRRAAVPAAAPRGRAADDHRPRDDPLLHDDPGGVAADPAGVAVRRCRATCSCSTWASRSGSSTWRATLRGSPAATPTRSRSGTSACDPARSSTSRCSTTPRRSSRPRHPKVLRVRRAIALRVATRTDVLHARSTSWSRSARRGDHAASRVGAAGDAGPARPGAGAGRPRERRAHPVPPTQPRRRGAGRRPSRSSTPAG